MTILQQIRAAAESHNLDPYLFQALVEHESSYRPSAYRFEPGFWRRYLADKPEWQDAEPQRVAASYGLCQVMYATALEHGLSPNVEPEYLFLPLVNLDLGAKILRELLDRFGGDEVKALAAYNAGTPDSPAGRTYAGVVLKIRDRLKGAQA